MHNLECVNKQFFKIPTILEDIDSNLFLSALKSEQLQSLFPQHLLHA